MRLNSENHVDMSRMLIKQFENYDVKFHLTHPVWDPASPSGTANRHRPIFRLFEVNGWVNEDMAKWVDVYFKAYPDADVTVLRLQPSHRSHDTIMDARWGDRRLSWVLIIPKEAVVDHPYDDLTNSFIEVAPK